MPETGNTPRSLTELAAVLDDAARKAPFFPAGLKETLTAAAEFCASAGERIERFEADHAELLAKLAEIEARLPAA